MTEEVKTAIDKAAKVNLEVESEVSDIVAAAKAACYQARSIGEMRRIKRLANEKIRFLVQMSRKEDFAQIAYGWCPKPRCNEPVLSNHNWLLGELYFYFV